MLHCLESSIEIRIRTSIREVVKRKFRDWGRPARVRIRHGKHKGIPSTARGSSHVRSAPMSKDLTESTNDSQLEDGVVFQ